MLSELIKSLFFWVTSRTLSSPKVHVQKVRVAGDQDKPALVITVTVENPQSQNTFVQCFEVRMVEPFDALAIRYEFREAQAEAVVKTLPLNIPGFGMSKPLAVIAHFDQSMISPTGRYRAKIAAIGRGGFRRRRTEIEGDSPWRN